MLMIGILLIAALLSPAHAMSFSALPDWLEIEAQLEIEVTREQNFDLAPPPSETLHVLRPELQLATSIRPGPGIDGFLLLELAHAFDLQDETDNDELTHAEITVKEAFITITGQALLRIPLSIQVGRQSLEDEREWWYDDELDAIRLIFHVSRFRLEATLARFALYDEDLANSQGADDTDFYHLYAQYAFGSFFTLAAYGLIQDDNKPEGERPAFLGLRVSGVVEPGLRYWLDAAHVRGKSEGQRLRGWGLDVGFLYTFDLVTQPLLMFSYAFGSGDDTPESSTNTGFRQTGLQGNSASYESVTDIQYYGELLDPELSNLHIFTAGLGFRPFEEASVTVLYHIYRQHTPSDELRDVAIDAEPTGLSPDVGREVDVVGGWAPDPFELKLIFGAFFPGNAFEPEAQNAFFAECRLTVEF
ncbi:alginate export family protein [Candidatus Entotheonella palauensis]|nr:alginate export family protein [Candidatus Entotheonella palauensis]